MTQTIKQFLNTPLPTLLPLEVAGHPARPAPSWTVTGYPFPRGQQLESKKWDRSPKPDPVAVVYAAPRTRIVQV